DVRPKDTFKLIWEIYKKDGKKVMDGRILAAQYNRRNCNNYTAIFFKDPKQHADYYTLNGKSLRRKFLRSPLNYRRISSYFSYRRFHPILKVYRPHLGIDYAAPIGTPVVAVGDGEVVYQGWNGGYGRFIKIRHDHSFYTTYGHLSCYAKGVRRGKRVRQGEVIGYVGSTGLSTGPHLDFRVIRDGRFVNFLRLNISSARSVDPRYVKEFEEVKKRRIDQLNSLGG
ncbi:MAG: M23 family metallopeptidase, partial [bacterium]|nr:M23 family metallopeptidase [bacterium]